MIGLTLKNFQERAVDFLLSKTTDSNSKNKIVIQSPTGSGKTIILVAYIEKYLDYRPNDIICWFCPGKGNLEEQSHEKMLRFTPNLQTGDLNSILTNGFAANTTYFINWETITKDGNIAIRDGDQKNLLERIVEAHRRGRRFLVIIDEEHQNDTAKANRILAFLHPRYEIRISATPTTRDDCECYEIDERDVINEELITRFMYINKGLEAVQVSNPKNEAEILLEKADEVQKEIAAAYVREKEDIRPLVLVQFPNLNDELIEFVENKLNEMGYTYENGLLASWFSGEGRAEKQSRKIGKINIGTDKEDSITRNNATPLFLLFKQALATGWDCPRAKILVKLRENMNETFEIQTLGRLRRMPKAKHYGRDVLDCSYLYTFDENYKLSVIQSGQGFETKRVFLKEEAKMIRLKKELRNRDGDYVDETEMRSRLLNFFRTEYALDTNKNRNRIRLENAGFILGTTLTSHYVTGRYSTLRQVNEEATQYGTLHTEVSTHTHGIDRRHCIDAIKKHVGLSYEKTLKILRTLFVKGYGKNEHKLLDLNLREFYAFVINNVDRLKADFIKFSGLTQRQMVFLENRIEDFSIPLEEHYRYAVSEPNVRIIDSNVYREYSTAMITDSFRSTSERLFEKYCEDNPNVKFVYKNGDNGQQYLSVVYGTNFDKQRLFYPDYIVQLQDESIWLIETKGGESHGQSKNIDVQVANKFLAFKEFAQKHKYNFGFVRDRNDELYLNNTEYVDDMHDAKWQLLKSIF